MGRAQPRFRPRAIGQPRRLPAPARHDVGGLRRIPSLFQWRMRSRRPDRRPALQPRRSRVAIAAGEGRAQAAGLRPVALGAARALSQRVAGGAGRRADQRARGVRRRHLLALLQADENRQARGHAHLGRRHRHQSAAPAGRRHRDDTARVLVLVQRRRLERRELRHRPRHRRRQCAAGRADGQGPPARDRARDGARDRVFGPAEAGVRSASEPAAETAAAATLTDCCARRLGRSGRASIMNRACGGQGLRRSAGRHRQSAGDAAEADVRVIPLLMLVPALHAVAAPAPVVALHVSGVIGPATAEYVERGLARAARERAQLVVLQLDTPGGLDTSMREIVQAILASPVPVAGFVAPSGARAASAGTFILYACHVAAMAPGTNLGAASPVSIGIGGAPPPPASPAGTPAAPSTGSAATEGKSPPPGTGVHERKAMQDAAAYIRNAAWGAKAVFDAASLSAQEALSQNVVDLVADDRADLLRRLDGRRIATAGGEHVLQLADAPITVVEPDWRSALLATITDPGVAMILMLVGIYGLIFEFGHPGYVFPGVTGAVSLLVGLYALHLLPVNYAGLALIGLGIAFMIAEVFVPAYGSLGAGGIVAFIVGATMLIDTDVPGFGLPLSLIVALALVSAAFVIVVVRMALRARRAPVVSGVSSLVGAEGAMVEDAGDAQTGWATIRGETWQVRAASPVTRGQRVRVVAMDGMLPRVAPCEGG